MPKDPSPLLGYNNNIKHRGKVFHVQTEDSGVKHPHIITHLFMDGGRILKSVKRSYAEHLGDEKMGETVRQMMKDQHKAMLVSLRDGQYDHLLGDGAAPAAPAPQSAPAPQKEVKITAKPAGAARSAADRAAGMAPTEPAMPASSRARVAEGKGRPQPEDEAPPTARNPTQPEELTLDIEALERAAAESSSPLFEQSDLPPPPANLFRERAAGGSYRTVSPVSTEKVRPTSRPPPPQKPASRPGKGASSRPPPAVARRATPRPPPPLAAKAPQRAGGRPKSAPPSAPDTRYVAARPAAAFGHSKPKPSNSIFGEDLISDKSLDEVILSYLAEDLEPSSEKKK